MNWHKFRFFLIAFLSSSAMLFAQYTEVINSNKPGFSESPYSVGTGVYQFESNLFLRNINTLPTFSRPQSLGLDLQFRTGLFLEKLEFNASISYQEDKVAFKNIFTSNYFTAGFSRMNVGAKYLVFEQKYNGKSTEIRSWKKKYAFDKKRLIPSIAIFLGMNTDLLNDIHKKGSISPKIGVLLQHNLTDNFNVITNFYYDNIGTDFAEYSYILTATQNFSNRWSAFFENQTTFQEYQKNTNLGIGLAYLYRRNLQFNTSARFLFEGEAKGYYAGLGISYRIDTHKDSFIELDNNGQKLKDTPISIYNKKQNNFFNRILNIFKKKEKTNRRRPKRKTRSRRKREGISGLFGKKKKKAKKNETEIEKLEREIKELEKEMRKEEKKNKRNGNN
jgi:hypothetical protein